MGLHRHGKTRLILSVTLLTGASGMIGQLLLLRELLVVFDGNELTIGIVVANWLILESLGALLAGRWRLSWRHSLSFHLFVIALYGVTLPVAVYFSRSIDQLVFGLHAGESAGIGVLFGASLMLSAVTSLLHGALFSLACRLLQGIHHTEQTVGKIYIFEALGTLLGASLLTLFLTRFDSMQLSLAITVLHMCGCLALWRLSPVRIHVSGIALQSLIVLALVLLLAFFPNLATGLQQRSLARQWPGQDIIWVEQTPYGQIVILHSKGEYSYFYDGRLLTSLPMPDRARLEDYAHLALLMHPDPESVLLIGGSLGGLAYELLRHPINQLVCVDLDARIPAVMQTVNADLVQQETQDWRLTIQNRDGRLYLSETEARYDMIILGLIQPNSLQTNRLFTHEFFRLARKCLQEEGLLVFSLPGSDAVLSPELAVLNASLYRTVRQTFPHVLLIPGELNLFVASSQPLEQDPAELGSRLEQRSVEASLFSVPYLTYRLSPDRIAATRQLMNETAAQINQDTHPTAFYHALVYWGRAYSPGLRRLFSALEQLHVLHYIAIFVFFPFAVLLLIRRIGRSGNIGVHFAVWSTGVTGMCHDLLILFLFQSLYGVVYQMAGLLMAAFMTGTLVGSLWTTHSRYHNKKRLFLMFEISLIALPVMFWGLSGLLNLLPAILPQPLLIAGMMLFSVLAGSITGGQFPLAAICLKDGQTDSGRIGGVLYAADLCGGWLGGLAVSVIWFPLLGLGQTLLLLTVLKAASLILSGSGQGQRQTY